MKLTVLGNNGPYPAPGGACSGYLLSGNDDCTHILIDCGAGVLSRLPAFCPPERLSAVILSHLHFDHMSDMLPMQYALQFKPRREPLPVYAPSAPKAVYDLLKCPQFELLPADDFMIGGIHIRFCPGRHPVPSNAVAAECENTRFVYTGDSNEDARVAAFCQGADLLLADSGLSREDHSAQAPHYSAELCGQLARDAGARALLLTHFNPRYDTQALLREARTRFPDAQLAVPGETYSI